MCEIKPEAQTKIDRLIEAMDRLTAALGRIHAEPFPAEAPVPEPPAEPAG